MTVDDPPSYTISKMISMTTSKSQSRIGAHALFGALKRTEAQANGSDEYTPKVLARATTTVVRGLALESAFFGKT